MFSVRRIMPAVLLMLLIQGCDGITDDLRPSGADKRPIIEGGTIGTQVGQQAPDFSLQDTLGNTRGLYAELAVADAVVLYFNMWCPICDAHASHMRVQIIPDFPNVSFFLVDYVTGSISASRAAQVANGYATSEVLVDIDQTLFNAYNASMGTTLVIDKAGIIQMKEDYKDGVKLTETLQQLP